MRRGLILICVFAIAHCILVSRANDSHCSAIVNFGSTNSVLIISFPKDIMLMSL